MKTSNPLNWLIVIPTVLALLAPLAPAAAPGRPDAWVAECIDCTRFATSLTDRSLRLDAAGRPHLAYGGDHLYYAWRDAGGTWQSETVDPALGVGAFASLAIDSAGYPHIAYQDTLNQDLKYAYQDAQGWHTETVDSTGMVGYHVSLALDQADRPHISHAYMMGSLYYAYQDGAGWHLENPASGDVRDTSLAMDGDGSPHIAYFDDDTGELRHAYRIGTTWTVATLCEAEFTDDSVSLAIDTADSLHVSFYDESGAPVGTLKYYHGSTGTIDSAQNGWFEYSSLALDAQGRPHVSYRDGLNRDLKYAYLQGGAWHTSVVDSGDDAGLHTSLVLDSGGRARTSYMDGGTIKYAYQDASMTWHIEVVDHTGSPGQGGASLALDAAGRAHVAYYDAAWNYDLKYARRGAGSEAWQLETVDGAGNVGWSPSLAIDSAGNPHIGYGGIRPNTAKYAYHDASGWHIETVGDALSPGQSLALDAAGVPHLAYAGLAGLTLAYRDGGSQTWYSETVSGAKGCIVDPALALDLEGLPHILCFDYGYPVSQLNYVYRDAGLAWHVELVAVISEIGAEPALHLDAAGAPHAAYVVWNGGAGSYDLIYAYRDGSDWHAEVVAGEGTTPSLDLDSEGNPHITYGNHYAVREPGTQTWRVETLPGESVYARSLALDAGDRPHIVISDGYHLKYVWTFEADHAVYLPIVANQH